MKQYLDLLNKILIEGHERKDRTGTGTIGIFGHQMRFDLQKGFPLITTKKLHLRSIIHELLWFISGNTNIKYLNDNGVTIWDEWANTRGELGPVYGKQWRNWSGIDQLQEMIDKIKNNPTDRRIIVNSWNVGEIQLMALPPCHMFYQAYVRNGEFLDIQMYQRSVDTFLGLPFNIASYALLTHMLAQVTGLKPGEFIWTGGDTHLYLNHLEQAKLQLNRTPTKLPTLKLNDKVKNIEDFVFDDFEILDYVAAPHIKAPISV